MKKARRKVSEYSSGELIQMARQAISKRKIGKKQFRELFDVDFTFKQLCSALHRRKCGGIALMNTYEYKEIEGLSFDQMEETFYCIMSRHENWIMENYENRMPN